MRAWIGALVCGVFAFTVPAQQAPVVAEWLRPPKSSDQAALWTLYAEFPAVGGVLADQAAYLEAIRERFVARRLAVVLLLPRGLRFASELPTAVPEVAPGDVRFTLCEGRRVLCTTTSSDGVVDRILDALDGSFDARFWQKVDKLRGYTARYLAADIDVVEAVARYVDENPRCAEAHVFKLRNDLWYRGDVAAAAASQRVAWRVLADEAYPLAVYADAVLRWDPPGRDAARAIVERLTPLVARSPSSVFLRLAHVRALLLAGDDDTAAAQVPAVESLVRADAVQRLWLAETLAESGDAARFREAAERALSATDGVAWQWQMAGRYKVALRCADDRSGAEAVTQEFIERMDRGRTTLNNEAWALMTDAATVGRFDDFAAALCERLAAEHPKGRPAYVLDTLALGRFLVGDVDAAIDLQQRAFEIGGAGYEVRLRRFRDSRD